MKKKVLRILGVAVTLVMVCSLAVALAPAAPSNEVSADPGAQKWTKFPTPRTGQLSSYLMTSEYGTFNGPGPVAKALDGTLYVYWDVGETDDLYKSTDNGRTWTRCSTSTDELGGTSAPYGTAIVDIATSREDVDLLYVCDTTTVYRSNDAGATFSAISPLTIQDSGVITSLDVGYDGSSHWIVVGTAHPSTAHGEVYVKQDPYLGPWQDQNITDGRRVVDVACAPDFSTTNPLIVAVTDNTAGAFVQYQYSGGAWTHETELKYQTAPTTTASTGDSLISADIAFPADMDSGWPNPNYFVGLDVDNAVAGDVYHVVAGTILDKDVNTTHGAANITSVAVAGGVGATMILAGSADNSNVYHSEDDGDTWYDSKYDPSGASFKIYVEVADDYYDSGIGWAFASGVASAMSQTSTFGVSWYQISLINTNIAGIHDLAFSPAYADDNTMFMVTDNSTGSADVWRWDGTYFSRVCDNVTHALTTVDFVSTSPKYTTDSAVFIADRTGNKIWRATDGGFRFKKQAGAPTWDSDSGWIVIDSSTVIVGKTSDAVHLTKNNGTTWSTKTVTGASKPNSFALSPDYDNDSTIIMGESDDGVFMSTDSGSTWKQVPAGIGVESGATYVYVAFDTDYADNNIIYAASGEKSDIYRLEVGKDTTWGNIDGRSPVTWPGTPQAATSEVSVIVTGNSCLYAADNGTANKDDVLPEDLPVLRSQNPTAGRSAPRGVYFEAMAGSWDTVTATGLWLTEGEGSNVLWTIASGDSIWAYEDSLIAGTTLLAPEEGFSTGREDSAKLQWEELPKATYYFVWVSTDEEFSTSEIQSTAYFLNEPWNTTTSTTSFTVKLLSAGKTYYWKIAAADSQWGNASSTAYDSSTLGKALSPWSGVRSFSTGIAGGEWNPFLTAEMFPGNVAPSSGATGVPLRPVFQWNAADWATGYEFLLADNPAYNPIVSLTGANALKTPTYALDKDLSYSTSYYWKVRAISETTESKWGEGVFTTMAKPAVPPVPPAPQPPVTIPPAPAPITPAYIWAIIGIGAILVIAVIVLIVRTRRVV